MFSIIIPTYNRRKKLLKCLSSLDKQTNKDFIVYIVNDSDIIIDHLKEEEFFFKFILIEDGRHLGPGHAALPDLPLRQRNDRVEGIAAQY